MIFSTLISLAPVCAFAIESSGVGADQTALSAKTSFDTRPPQDTRNTTFSSLDDAIQDARLNRLGIAPDSPNGLVIKRWAERMRNDVDIRKYFGDESRRTNRMSPDASSQIGQGEWMRRLSPAERSKMIELTLKAVDNAPQDCGGVKSESAVISRYMPLSTMSTDDVDAFMGIAFAMFKQVALQTPLAQVTKEQRWQASRVFRETLEAQLNNDPEGMRDVAATAVDPTSVSTETWCRNLRIYNRAILAMPQPDRDWFLLAGVIDNANSHSDNTSSFRAQPEIDVSAQTYPLKVQRRVAPNIVWTGPTQGLETTIAVRCAPSGALLSVSIVASSGNAEWDKAALRAVQRSDPMPLDTGGVAPSKFSMRLRPSAW
ncbi:energy transducer TonB [Caballeronia sp. ATUFL_M2_KS44]|uniref:energy transducer TonB n=1 Tax=Caballeronia sp. ATUFL_M2_KS44 TaxID=2921767 RepID=UPI0020294C59